MNQFLVESLGLKEASSAYGLRLGEALNCIHASKNECGCGTTAFCSTCGAVKAILSGIQGNRSVEECRVVQETTYQALDLRVAATPFETDGQQFVIFAVEDISHEKRRRILERVFFHDVSNTVQLLSATAELLIRATPTRVAELANRLSRLSYQLIDEIAAQKDLLAAENGELAVQPAGVHSGALVREVVSAYECTGDALECRVAIDPNAQEIEFTSDQTLLARVLGNMLKNALEASGLGDTVTVGCELHKGDRVRFWVHNPGVIPRESQLQIFERSYSTKGPGRGLGTYCMRLLSERYLKGSVGFTTSAEDGTNFAVDYPLVLD